MKKIIILGFVVISVVLFATQMIVHLENGNTVPFNIEDIESITFGNDVFQEDFDNWNDNIWEGQGWSGNSPTGSWQPEVSNGVAHFQTDNYSWGMIRTLQTWEPGYAFSYTFTPYLESGGPNGNRGCLGISSNWLAYDDYGSNTSAGFTFLDGIVYAWLEINDAIQWSYQTLGAYNPGDEITITINWNSDGSLLLQYGDEICTIDSAEFPTNYARILISSANSIDGIDVNQVTVTSD